MMTEFEHLFGFLAASSAIGFMLWVLANFTRELNPRKSPLIDRPRHRHLLHLHLHLQ
jgi:hypothetical protein